jgi:hypothetical protein
LSHAGAGIAALMARAAPGPVRSAQRMPRSCERSGARGGSATRCEAVTQRRLRSYPSGTASSVHFFVPPPRLHSSRCPDFQAATWHSLLQ